METIRSVYLMKPVAKQQPHKMSRWAKKDAAFSSHVLFNSHAIFYHEHHKDILFTENRTVYSCKKVDHSREDNSVMQANNLAYSNDFNRYIEEGSFKIRSLYKKLGAKYRTLSFVSFVLRSMLCEEILSSKSGPGNDVWGVK